MCCLWNCVDRYTRNSYGALVNITLFTVTNGKTRGVEMKVMSTTELERKLGSLDYAKARVICTWMRRNYAGLNKKKMIENLLPLTITEPEKLTHAINLVDVGVNVVSTDEKTSTTTLDEDRVQKLIALWTEQTIDNLNADKFHRLSDSIDSIVTERIKLFDKEAAKAFKLAESARPIVVKKAGEKSKRVKGVLPKEFERIVQLASQRVHTMLVGPAGCGKTFIAAKVAEVLDLQFSSISCSVGMSESQLAGWLLPTGASGKFEYVSSQFVEMYEKGGVFLLDELDSADPNTITFLNKALAGDYFFIPQRFKKPKVVRHQDFVCVAAANTFGNGADAMYVGRNQLDAATRDRFTAGMIYMDYSPEVEESIVDEDILKWGRHIRSKIQCSSLRRVMSTRTMIDLTKMKKAYGWDRQQWEESYFADWSESERRNVDTDSIIF